MTDQNLLLIGSAASSLSDGLLKTGKFIRLSFSASETRNSTPAPDPNNGAQNDAPHKKRWSLQEEDDTEENESQSIKKYLFNANVNTIVFVLRGGRSSVSTVLAVLREYQDDFSLDASDGEENIRVQCMGSRQVISQVLNEIRARL